MTTQKLNEIVLKITEKKMELPNTGNLEDAEFLHQGWKPTDSNNSSAIVCCIGTNKGKYKFELMRRICALANAGGGILLWGIDESTAKV